MGETVLQSQVWLLSGMTASAPGILQLADGRIAFATSEGAVFDVALSAVTGVEFPWYYFGGGMKLKIGAESYRFSFMLPGNMGGGIGDIGPGRRIGKEWKAALTLRA